MARIDQMARQFLALKRIAVVGVSDQRDTGCNLAYRNIKESGRTVIPVNPRLTTFDGETCYPDLTSIPERPDGVFILANPGVTERIVDECVDLGIRHVWMHCMMGTKPGLVPGMTSVSPKAVRTCRDNGIEVIPGSCPNQFLASDFGHRAMRWLWGGLGLMRISEPTA